MLTNTQKQLAILKLKLAIENAKANVGIATLAELETGVAALETAYGTDPDTVTAANLDAMYDKLSAFSIEDLNSNRTLFTQIDSEANA